MSHPPPVHSKSHSTAWVLSVLALLLLYTATWPVVEIKAAANIAGTLSFSSGSGTVTLPRTISVKPKWVGVVYWPMHYLSRINQEHNPLYHYYQWWEGVLA